MAQTLILIFHPDMARSRANKALAMAAARLPGTEVIDMQALYPSGQIDADAEVARLLAAERIVLQFPVQWYAAPPLLRVWQDLVLTRMFYLRAKAEGRLLTGKPLLVAATAGNTEAAYSPEGVNLFPLEQLLAPLHAMAHRCGLPWAKPCLLYEANRLDDAALEAAGQRYADHLGRWAVQPVQPIACCRP